MSQFERPRAAAERLGVSRFDAATVVSMVAAIVGRTLRRRLA
jgi:hypothetical protein